MALADLHTAEKPFKDTSQDVAGLDVVLRSLLSLGKKKTSALNSLIQKGMRSADETDTKIFGKYDPNVEHGAYNEDDPLGITHYRPKNPKKALADKLQWEPRDAERWLERERLIRENPDAPVKEAWQMHSHPGGGTLSPADAEVMGIYPTQTHGIVEVPRHKAGVNPYETFDPNLSSYEEFSFPTARNQDFKGVDALGRQVSTEPFYAQKLVDGRLKHYSNEVPWMKPILNKLQKQYPEVPRELLINDLRRAVLGRMAENNKKFDYMLATPDTQRFDDIMKAYVDKTKARRGSLSKLK